MFKLKFLIIFFLASFSLQFAKAQTPAKADLVANCSVNNPSFPFLTYAPGKSEANAITANVVVTSRQRGLVCFHCGGANIVLVSSQSIE